MKDKLFRAAKAAAETDYLMGTRTKIEVTPNGLFISASSPTRNAMYRSMDWAQIESGSDDVVASHINELHAKLLN